MTFGINANHLINGIKNGYNFPNQISINSNAIPIVYNVGDASTIVNLLNTMLLPKPKLFVGTIKFSTTPVNDARSLQLYDPAGTLSFYYTDSNAINGAREQFFSLPLIFSRIECTLNAKYSLQIFGYLLEYNF